MVQGGKLLRSRFSSSDWIIGAGETGAVLYSGNRLHVGSVWPHSCSPHYDIKQPPPSPSHPRPIHIGREFLKQTNILCHQNNSLLTDSPEALLALGSGERQLPPPNHIGPVHPTEGVVLTSKSEPQIKRKTPQSSDNDQNRRRARTHTALAEPSPS